jgi:hypothetical protein
MFERQLSLPNHGAAFTVNPLIKVLNKLALATPGGMNPVFFVLVYALGMLPTYVLPYFSGVSLLGTALTGSVVAFLPGLHLASLLVCIYAAYCRGAVKGTHAPAALAVAAAVFDLTPVLSWVPFVPTVLHLVTLVVGVMGPSSAEEGKTLPAMARYWLGALLVFIPLAVTASLAATFVLVPKPGKASAGASAAGRTFAEAATGGLTGGQVTESSKKVVGTIPASVPLDVPAPLPKLDGGPSAQGEAPGISLTPAASAPASGTAAAPAPAAPLVPPSPATTTAPGSPPAPAPAPLPAPTSALPLPAAPATPAAPPSPPAPPRPAEPARAAEAGPVDPRVASMNAMLDKPATLAMARRYVEAYGEFIAAGDGAGAARLFGDSASRAQLLASQAQSCGGIRGSSIESFNVVPGAIPSAPNHVAARLKMVCASGAPLQTDLRFTVNESGDQFLAVPR